MVSIWSKDGEERNKQTGPATLPALERKKPGGTDMFYERGAKGEGDSQESMRTEGRHNVLEPVHG